MEKLKNKRCVYLIQINGKLIKIGSTADIVSRFNSLIRTYGKNCIILDAFEHNDHIAVERDILIKVRENLYKEKVNGHISKEIVKLSEQFNYNQLLKIVHDCLHGIRFLTPGELLKKQILELELKIKLEETKRLELISNLIKDDKFHYIESLLESPMSLNNEVEPEQKPEQKPEQEPEQARICKVTKEHLKFDNLVKGRKPKGQKIEKIDPNNLSNVIATYDSMVYVLRSPECRGFNKSGILNAINNSRIYKNYRWNFVGRPILPTNEYKYKPPIIETIIQLNEQKDLIVDTFLTKDIVAKKLGISKMTMRNIIINEELYNSHYYIEYSKCPIELIEKYNKPIVSVGSVHAQKVKQINPITKETVVFNNYNEIYIKFGISSKTLIDVITNKLIYHGCLWEYEYSN